MTDDFSKQLVKAMQEYSEGLEKNIKDIMTEVGAEAKQIVSGTSPKRTGKYARGWKVKKTFRKGKFEVTVHNSRYQLTHLLENGHRKRSGTGWVKAQPHIAKVNEWSQNELEKQIKKVAQQ